MPDTRRLFFALWPDEAGRQAVMGATAAVVEAAHGRPTPRANLHVTVAFLGNLGEDACERAMGFAAVPVGTIELVFDRIERRRGSGMLWLLPQSVPEALQSLEHSLWQWLREAGFERESRPYRPHITLARRTQRTPALVPEPVRWRIGRLSLIESVPSPDGPVYERLVERPLA